MRRNILAPPTWDVLAQHEQARTGDRDPYVAGLRSDECEAGQAPESRQDGVAPPQHEARKAHRIVRWPGEQHAGMHVAA